MAIKNLEQELEAIFVQIFKPDQLKPTLPGKKKKLGGSEDPVRAFLDTMALIFDIKKADIVEQIEDWKASDGTTVKKVKQYEKVFIEEGASDISAEIKKLIRDTADEVIAEFGKVNISSTKFDIKRKTIPDGVRIICTPFKDADESSVYNKVNDLKKEVSEKVFKQGESGTKLWKILTEGLIAIKNRNRKEGQKPRSSGISYGGVFNVGHAEPVGKMSAAFLQDGIDSIEDNELISKEISVIKAKAAKKFGDLNLDFQTARKAAVWENGRLIPNPNQRFYVKTNIETQFKNQIQNQMKGYDEGAKEAGIKASELLEEIRELLDRRYKFFTAKGWTEKAMSTPFIDQIGAGIVFDKSLRELYKRGLAKNLTKWKSIPKNTPLQNTKPKRKKYKTTVKTYTKIPLSPPKGIRTSKRQEKGFQESDINDTFELRAFINSRLSKQVSKNMGRPALENRTGRFASSVKVENAVKKGNVANIDYTYDRERYGSFEGGKRYPIGYDPRPLIERSIREIAIAKMESKFTFRRL